MPLLGAALEACVGPFGQHRGEEPSNRARLRPRRALGPAVGELVAALGAGRQVIVSSFWPRRSPWPRGQAHPDVATGLLYVRAMAPEAAVSAALDRGCSALHPGRRPGHRRPGGGRPRRRPGRLCLDGQRPGLAGRGPGPRGRHGDHRRRAVGPGRSRCPALNGHLASPTGRSRALPLVASGLRGLQLDWSERRISSTMRGHERRCMREADP